MNLHFAGAVYGYRATSESHVDQYAVGGWTVVGWRRCADQADLRCPRGAHTSAAERPRVAGPCGRGGRTAHGEPRRRGALDDARAVRRVRTRREGKGGGHHPPLWSEGGVGEI